MNFMNEEHKKFVEECCAKAKKDDCYHRALFYALGLTWDCRNNIDSLYDWKEHCVKQIEGENYGWITGTDIRIIRFAYNLFNNGTPTAYPIENLEKKLDEVENYLPTALFGGMSGEMMEFMFEAIRIRYEWLY